MPPSVDLTAAATPSDFGLPSPTLPAHFLAGLSVQTEAAAPFRYFWKFSVVPDSSDRKNTLTGVDGRVAEALIALIAGSSQVLIVPLNSFAATSGVSTSLSTPLRLYEIAIGPATIGRFQASLPVQRALAASASGLPPSAASVFRAESEPAKSTWPALNCLIP